MSQELQQVDSSSVESILSARRAQQRKTQTSSATILAINTGKWADFPDEEIPNNIGHLYLITSTRDEETGKRKRNFRHIGKSVTAQFLASRVSYAHWNPDDGRVDIYTNEHPANDSEYPVGIKVSGQLVATVKAGDVRNYLIEHYPDPRNAQNEDRGFKPSSMAKWSNNLYVLIKFKDENSEIHEEVAKMQVRGGNQAQQWFNFNNELDDALEASPFKISTKKVENSSNVQYVPMFSPIVQDGEVVKNDNEKLAQIFTKQNELDDFFDLHTTQFLGVDINQAVTNSGQKPKAIAQKSSTSVEGLFGDDNSSDSSHNNESNDDSESSSEPETVDSSSEKKEEDVPDEIVI